MPVGLFGIGQEDEARARRHRLGHGLEVVGEVAQRDHARRRRHRLHDHAVDDEGLVGHHRLVARPEEGAHDELDDLVRAVADEDVVRRHAVPLGQAPAEIEGGAVRVEMDGAERVGHRRHRPRRRAERVLVRGELDRARDAELALHLLDRLARRIRRERPDPLGHEMTDVHQRSGSGRRRVRAQHLQPQRAPLHGGERPRHARLAAMPLQVEEEVVLPRPLAQRARLDLDQIDAVRRERPQHARQDADLVAHAHHQRGLVVAARGLAVVSPRGRGSA